MKPLEELFVDAIEYTSNSASQFHTTQNELIINSLKTHLIVLESSFKKEETSLVLIDVAHIILSQNPHTISKLSENQKVILQQMDKVSFCITNVSELNYLQKNDILNILCNENMQQCIDKIIQHVKDVKKN